MIEFAGSWELRTVYRLTEAEPGTPWQTQLEDLPHGTILLKVDLFDEITLGENSGPGLRLLLAVPRSTTSWGAR